MSTATLLPTGSVGTLEPIALEELVQRAALLTRIDRKYVVPIDRLDDVVGQLGGTARVLEINGARSSRYRSVYFDTADLVAYHGAAYRRRRRFKVRTRSYLDTETCWLEVKTRGTRDGTVKSRREHRPDADADLVDGGRFVRDTLTASGFSIDAGALAPRVWATYLRTTLFLPNSASRMTIDVDVRWADGASADRELAGAAIVETKAVSGPCEGDRSLWAQGFRPARISKYATGLAALQSVRTATPWRRTLRRYLDQEENS